MYSQGIPHVDVEDAAEIGSDTLKKRLRWRRPLRSTAPDPNVYELANAKLMAPEIYSLFYRKKDATS